MDYYCQSATNAGTDLYYACDPFASLKRPLYETAAYLDPVQTKENDLDKGLRLLGELLTSYWAVYLVAVIVILVLVSLTVWIENEKPNSGYSIFGAMAIVLFIMALTFVMSGQFDQNWAEGCTEYSEYSCEDVPLAWSLGAFLGHIAGFCAVLLAWGIARRAGFIARAKGQFA